MMAILLVLVFLLMAAVEVVPLWRQKRRKEMIWFGVVWGVALAFDLALTLGAKLPNPTRGIIWINSHLQSYLFGPGG